MEELEWSSRFGNAEEYAQVVDDDHTWFSLSSVELHVWTHKPSESRINVDSLDRDSYMLGVHSSFHFMYQC